MNKIRRYLSKQGSEWDNVTSDELWYLAFIAIGLATLVVFLYTL